MALDPGPPAGSLNVLTDVAIGPDGTVWAVGLAMTAISSSHVMRVTGPPLSTWWTGAAWQALIAPGAGSGAGFYGVTLAPGGEMWAVGGRDNGVLAMRWTGSAWAGIPLPAGSGPQASGVLAGVAFSSSGDGWAVGTYLAGKEFWPLILHWDGTAWN
jgi:hypothetical protein